MSIICHRSLPRLKCPIKALSEQTDLGPEQGVLAYLDRNRLLSLPSMFSKVVCMRPLCVGLIRTGLGRTLYLGNN